MAHVGYRLSSDTVRGQRSHRRATDLFTRRYEVAAKRRFCPLFEEYWRCRFHATLALEIVELWKYVFPGSNYDVQILEERRKEGAGESLCEMMNACATDSRFRQLFDEHVETKVKLPKSGYPNPSITDLNAFITAFVQMFGSSLGQFERDKEIFVCTEPAVMCWALRLAFPDHPIVGYFGNPLLTYLGMQEKTVQLHWLQEFHHLSNFVPVASTRFLAEQMRYQASRPVGAVRPLALYLDAAYQPPATAILEFLVLRQPFVFWDTGCVLNSLARLNGIQVNFVYSDFVKPTRSYRAWSQWHALIFMPYDASQMRFYEFYAMGMPIFLPPRNCCRRSFTAASLQCKISISVWIRP
eukprot:GEMP01033151.1.p1 GENE.GEMP01033151.1~~GEMP01033151.1.p1  ORF type:complete len:354 (+),score=60.80 GEMP01033151.1:441-1502(+)